MGDVHLEIGRPPAAERADAARNRQRILDAAARLMADQGPEAVTMNAVAQAAGIGVGTVYRRFGDVTQLLLALVDHRELQFQQSFLSGPAPLGPGEKPGERLRAFLHALTDHVAGNIEVMLAAENASPTAIYASGPYEGWHLHVSTLLRELRPGADATVLADLLLSFSPPSLIWHLTKGRGFTTGQIKASIDELLAGFWPQPGRTDH
ncbi:TetR/AcrR family transcriptional regulator [Actinoplanes solisilvae]|uniref:TetR/AcrR family transcriptional regulator n=1 Tax=Actinoplanes solisilvae TaxID=2486853 RepID=UPI000FD810FF|nr:TetR/AcrR family transcriptional regulator [Actinoplanes solisilvae]